MTLSQSQQFLPIPADRIMEIQAMAEAGKFGDALVRIRTIKASSPRNTFLVAVEQQLERLIVMPAEADPRDSRRTDALGSIPKLLSCAVEGMRLSHMAATVQSRMPKTLLKPRSEKEQARERLKDQYFLHAEEYMKEGAYGSALVEIRRVRIITPNDSTVAAYERIIRQLVELKQRAGVQPLTGKEDRKGSSASPPGVPTGTDNPKQTGQGTTSQDGSSPRHPDPPGKWFGGKLLFLVVGSSVLLAVVGATLIL